MTYTEIKAALKSLQVQGYVTPPLNSKREVLEKALNDLQALIAELEEMPVEDSPAAIDPEPIKETVEISINPQPTEEILEVAINPIEEITFPADTLPLQIIPRTTETPRGWELISLEIKDDLKFVGTVLIWGVALIRSIIRFSTPYVKKTLRFTLKALVYGAVAFSLFILPKIMIALYYLGIWGITIALKIVHSRRWSIA